MARPCTAWLAGCAERAWWKSIVILDHIFKAASFETWQAVVERQCGSGTGCAAVLLAEMAVHVLANHCQTAWWNPLRQSGRYC